MSREAMLPCFKCGRILLNALADSDNQPQEGTEFRTYGHYGSTFWDSLEGEELVLNICDACLGEHRGRLAQHKRFLPVRTTGGLQVGKQWVERPMVAYTGHPDGSEVKVEPEEIGTALPNIEWAQHPEELRQFALHMDRNPASWCETERNGGGR